MKKRKITVEEAKKMIKTTKYKSKTIRFFDGSLQIDQLYEMFKEFTDDERIIIIAALRLVGAQFNYD